MIEIINIIIIAINGYLAYYNYKKENYKVSLINSFTCGYCANILFT